MTVKVLQIPLIVSRDEKLMIVILYICSTMPEFSIKIPQDNTTARVDKKHYYLHNKNREFKGGQ